jgi:beta-galactosidase
MTRIHLGAAYYPEHWPQTRWPEDVRLMRESGLSVVRMGEFAWSTLEPSAGEFHFEWLDRAIQLLAENGIQTVLGTPTAAPPAWLVQQVPSILAVDERGDRVQFGNRCHYCVHSPEFHQATSRLVGALAGHFGSNPHVIGWQIDNEFSRVCYCRRSQECFQKYLQEKFGSLEALNQCWSTRYWSQTYSAWEQIPTPLGAPIGAPPGWHNPGLMLEFKHFVTHSYRAYQKQQVDLLRPHLPPGVWITHNFMNWYDGYDHYPLAEDLDMASWDWYVPTGHHDYRVSGAAHDLVYGFKRQPFWLMETQPGCVNWAPVNTGLDKGEGRAMAWHAIAHGADAVLYWQWRSAPGGQEQYHGTLVDPSGQPRPFLDEVRQLSQELSTLPAGTAGSTPKTRVVLLHDYASRWSLQWQPHHRDFDYVAHLLHYYRPLAVRNARVRLLPPQAIEPAGALAGVKLVIAPALAIVPQRLAAALRDYVSRGGHLVVTLRSGVKDNHNALLPTRPPGPLADLAGVEVEDYYALADPIPVQGKRLQGEARLWAERLRPREGRTLQGMASFGPSNGWLDGQPAITVHPYGKGLVYYVGAYLDEAAQQALVDSFLENAQLPLLATPAGVEVRVRTKADGEDLYFVINHTPQEQILSLPWPAYHVLNGEPLQGPWTLPPYGTAVLTRQ